MTAPTDILRRLGALESEKGAADRSVMVLYEAGETEDEIRARIPPGDWETVLLLPNNHRDGPANEAP